MRCLPLLEAQTELFDTNDSWICWFSSCLPFFFLGTFCISVPPDSEDEDVKKSKKSPKAKQKMNKTEPPPKKDPVQYVSETGNGTLVYRRITDPCCDCPINHNDCKRKHLF